MTINGCAFCSGEIGLYCRPKQKGACALMQFLTLTCPGNVEVRLNGTGLVFFDQPQAHSEAECSSRPAMASEPRIKIFDDE